MVDTPHFLLPFQFKGDSVPEVEEDSTDEIIQCIFAVLSYQKKQLFFMPRFGLPEQAFRQNGASLQEIQAAINENEPRASTAIVESGIPLLTLTDLVGVRVSDRP